MRLPGSLSRLPGNTRYVFAFAAGLSILVAGIVLFVHFHHLAVSRQSVEELVAQADKEISGGFYRAAMPYLERAMRSADTRDSWLAIAKRAYAIAEGSGNYAFLLRVANRGTQNLPGSQELWAIKVLAEARGGEPAAGETTATAHLTDPRFQSFGTEAVLRAHPALNIGGTALSKKDRQIIDTLTSRSPALFENLAHEIGSSDLLFDAALLYAWKGDLKAAYTLLISLGGNANPQAGMLISYDAGELESAKSYFQGMPQSDQTPSFQLLADDLLVLQKQYDKAAAAYQVFLEGNPRTFWMPYVNLAWLAADGKTGRVSVKAAMDDLRKAVPLFPDQREVVLSLASLERRTGESRQAASLLSQFLQRHPWDLDANLLSMEVSGASENPARLRSKLWDLFYRAQGTNRDRIARYLGWYLLGLDDYQGMRIIFSQMQKTADGDWLPFYRGIYHAMLGQYASSITSFHLAYSTTARWQTLFNLGIVEMKSGTPQVASQDLQKADTMLTTDTELPVKARERAAVHVALAQALELTGNTEAAKREVLYALDIDPRSLSAALLLKKLDSSAGK